MVFKSKIKWVALMGLALSVLSLATHLILARYSVRKPDEGKPDIQTVISFRTPEEIPPVDPKYRKTWGAVKSLIMLRPYAVPRKFTAAPNVSNGFLFARIKGEFHEIRSSIVDLVVVAKILNATLVLPELQEVASAKGISSKLKGFGYIYNDNHFISALAKDVLVIKNLPKRFKMAKKKKAVVFKNPPFSASPQFYIKEVLPELRKEEVVRLIISEGGCLKNILPAGLVEYQRLRCRVAFEALRFRRDLEELGSRMVQRLQALGQPYLAFHTGLERDVLAYHGCAERFQDVHTQVIQYKRALMINKGVIKAELNVDSELQRGNGSCPLMPEEVGILLRALGYGPHTRIYISGAEIFGGQRVLIPLRAMFNNLEDRTTITTEEERSVVYGPVEPLPPPPPPPPFVDDEKLRLAAWEKAGPRPRPLPPPPSRKKFPHEVEGWWGWVGESDKEPEPSLADLREQAHKLLWAALDYIVCVESNAFFPGFDRDRNGKPNFASLVMGHRAYEFPALRTYRPDRKLIVKLLEEVNDHLYHPKWAWVVSVRGYLRETLGYTGLWRSSKILKRDSFLSHPLPECSCRLPEKNKTSSKSKTVAQGSGDKSLSGNEEICPEWMLEIAGQANGPDEVEEEVDEAKEAELLGFVSEAEESADGEADKPEKEDGQLQDADEDADSDD